MNLTPRQRYTKEWRKKNSNHLRKGNKAYRQKHAKKIQKKQRARQLKRKYGLTAERYSQLVASHDGRCHICSTIPKSGMGKSGYVDHCHKTGKVRGWLCQGCNTGLGGFRDNPKFLQAAIKYLSFRGNEGTRKKIKAANPPHFQKE